MQVNKISDNCILSLAVFVLILLSSSHKVYGQDNTPSCDSITIERFFNPLFPIDNWLLQQSRTKQNDSITFEQFLDLFNPIDTTDSLLHLHRPYLDEYKDINIDSINTPFFLNVPYFTEYATFRVDCVSGHLVGVNYSYVDNASLFHYLELISYDTIGRIIGRESLPLFHSASYSWRKTGFENALLYLSAKKIRFYYQIYSPTGQIPCKEINYDIEHDGTIKKIETYWFYETEKEYQSEPPSTIENYTDPFY